MRHFCPPGHVLWWAYFLAIRVWHNIMTLFRRYHVWWLGSIIFYVMLVVAFLAYWHCINADRKRKEDYAWKLKSGLDADQSRPTRE